MDKPDLSHWSPEVQRNITEAPRSLRMLADLYAGFREHILTLQSRSQSPDLERILARQHRHYTEIMGVTPEETSLLIDDAAAMIEYNDSQSAA